MFLLQSTIKLMNPGVFESLSMRYSFYAMISTRNHIIINTYFPFWTEFQQTERANEHAI